MDASWTIERESHDDPFFTITFKTDQGWAARILGETAKEVTKRVRRQLQWQDFGLMDPDLEKFHVYRSGTWQVTDAYPHTVYCSECHARFAQTEWAVWEDGSLPRSYCPNCGARMEADDGEIY